MSDTAETILEAAGLRVVFFRRGDRYVHRIDGFDAATQTWCSLLESAEGTDDEAWPPSPPLQQLHVERRASGDVVLLVGMAGRTHWSAAVEVAADGRGFTFDVAARVQTAPLRLGSRYHRGRVDDEPSPDRATKLPGVVLRGANVSQDRLQCEPPPIARPPATATWRYEIRVE